MAVTYRFDDDTQRKREDSILKNIAKKLWENSKNGKLKQLIIDWQLEINNSTAIDSHQKDESSVPTENEPSISIMDNPTISTSNRVNVENQNNVEADIKNQTNVTVSINLGVENTKDRGKDLPKDTFNIEPKPAPTPIETIIDSGNRKPIHEKKHFLVIFIAIGVFILWGVCKYFFTPPPVEKIFVSENEVNLKLGETYKLATAILPRSAQNARLNYVSSNPDIITVTDKGLVSIQDVSNVAIGSQANVTIQAGSGATTVVTFIVCGSDEDTKSSNSSTISSDNDDFAFGIIVKVRLADYGSDPSWKNEVTANIGDKVEFQIQYKNLSDFRQPSVMIRNVLPKSLRYVEGSTYLFNTLHPNGGHINEDTVIANGVNIGNYLPGANAYLRITAEVVGDTMACGKNVLVDWGQGQAGPEVGKQIVLQDYAIVNVYKP